MARKRKTREEWAAELDALKARLGELDALMKPLRQEASKIRARRDDIKSCLRWHDDPKFRDHHRKLAARRNKARYHNDPAYRERARAAGRRYYERLRADAARGRALSP